MSASRRWSSVSGALTCTSDSRYCRSRRRTFSSSIQAVSYPYLTDVLHAAGINVPLPIPTFGLLVGIAFFTGKWLAGVEARRLAPTLSPDVVSNTCIYGFIAGLLGARLFHIL